jgi:hypothetical protein
MLTRLYHRIMIWYYGWRIKRQVQYLRRMGKKHGLPSLDEWTDEQVVEGIKQYYERN